ncbi:ribonuclease R [Clostridia bacterium]|nr:ribonuclease R [Clostridia bacterium]
MNYKPEILKIVNDGGYKEKPYNKFRFYEELSHEEKEVFRGDVDELLSEGQIFLNSKNKIILPEKHDMYIGVLSRSGRGGFVDVPRGRVFIKGQWDTNAVVGDKVLVKIIRTNNDGDFVGTIAKIIARGSKTAVCTCVCTKKAAFCTPINPKLNLLIKIKKDTTLVGHFVLVSIDKYYEGETESGRIAASGELLEDLGERDAAGVDITAIVCESGIPRIFGDDVLAQARGISQEVGDYPNRTDLTGKQIITIDGDDTKDIDDAVCAELLGNGNYLLTVSIADVSEYVAENSALDKEALRRGTSVYLADRVIPMLPPELSNGICSLNENVRRLALSCEMEIAPSDGAVVNHRIFESVIKSRKKMTYDEVLDIIENDAQNEYSGIIRKMYDLSLILKKKRADNGAIEFSSVEAKFKLDKRGKVSEITAHIPNAATELIEEFMVLCNETVAKEYNENNIPFVYRCHDIPTDQSFIELSDTIKNLGENLGEKNPKAYRNLLESVRGTQKEAVVNRMVLRSMKQAVYDDNSRGHFGLALKYYAHFTSPIRRYPDLQIHRIIKMKLRGELTEDAAQRLNGILPEVCAKSSSAERVADGIEREVSSLKKVEYMLDQVGKTFDGIVSGVTGWGVYVSLENTVEGMIPLNTLSDYYIYKPETLTLAGSSSGKTFFMGQKLKVTLKRADLFEKRLDFGVKGF